MLRGNGKICGDDGCGVGAGLQNGPICYKAAGRRRAPSPTMVCRKKFVGAGITRPHRLRIIVVMLIRKDRRQGSFAPGCGKICGDGGSFAVGAGLQNGPTRSIRRNVASADPYDGLAPVGCG